MSFIAHFIDNNWKLQKKILSQIKVKDIVKRIWQKNVEICLDEWELNQVFSVTVDNASSNDLGIQHLKKRFIFSFNVRLKGDYIHMRCCAHILYLIVKYGLKHVKEIILRIRAAIKYIRSSPSRLAKFKGYAEQEKILYNGLVCLDMETRWNSTYLMLEAAIKYQKTFDRLEMEYKKYVDDLQRRHNVPS
ncbi:hypothetical protein AAZX31_17G202200 [Glycine max]